MGSQLIPLHDKKKIGRVNELHRLISHLSLQSETNDLTIAHASDFPYFDCNLLKIAENIKQTNEYS